MRSDALNRHRSARSRPWFKRPARILVDGRKVDIPSYSLRPEQRIAIKPESPMVPVVQAALDLAGRVHGWLEADVDALAGRVLREPRRDEIPTPVEEQLIVEYFARR